MRVPTLLLLSAGLTACATVDPDAPPPPDPIPSVRPAEVLQPGFDPAFARSDLLATARERFGEAAVQRALASSTYLFAKRFYGMVPPPPPGAGADWRAPTPTALLIREGGQWLFATADGWRPAKADVAADIDRRIAEARLWSEQAYTPPCPDFGANLLLLKVPGKAETVRQSLCSGAAADLVQAALTA
ncbi:MAG TPA: hypothetical protein VIL42_11725 [Sphingomicrobium sp.]|jgi:hypothetical protein